LPARFTNWTSFVSTSSEVAEPPQVPSTSIVDDCTWGGSATSLLVLTNDVQFVNLAGNPYAFAYSGYLQAPAQPSART